MVFSSTIFENEEDISIPYQAVVLASKLCQSVRAKEVVAETGTMTKLDRSPVTVADYGSQAIICKTLREKFPNDPVVAEEDAKDLRLPTNKEQLQKISTYVRSALLLDDETVSEEDIMNWIDHGNGNSSTIPNDTQQRFWTLDPIDGTKGFLRGDQYAVCLALVENSQVKIGIIACPALELDGKVGHIFLAEKDKGAWRKSLDDHEEPLKRIEANPEIKSMIQSVEAGHGNHTAQEAVAKACGIEAMIKMDSQAKYCMVASGCTALYLRLSSRAENIWDHTAGIILVEEAGGKVSDRNGKRYVFPFGRTRMTETNGVVVTNGNTLHDKVLATLTDFR